MSRHSHNCMVCPRQKKYQCDNEAEECKPEKHGVCPKCYREIADEEFEVKTDIVSNRQGGLHRAEGFYSKLLQA